MCNKIKYPKEVTYTIPSIKNDGRINTFIKEVEHDKNISVLLMYPATDSNSVIFSFEVSNKRAKKKLDKIYNSIFKRKVAIT